MALSYSYRDPYDSPLVRLFLWLSRSFRVGRFFGVEVRLYWIAAVLVPLMFLAWFAKYVGNGLELLVLVTVAFVNLFVIVWSHEMGHILAGRWYGIRTPLITLSPLGGVAHMGAPATTPKAEAVIALAGPAVHLVWLAVCWPLSWLLPWGTVHVPGWRNDPVALTLSLLVETNLGLLVFNLLPFFPLDGGRVFRALLSFRVHPNRATMIATAVGIAGGAGLALYGLFTQSISGSILFFIGLAIVQAALNERRAARHVLIYRPHGNVQREVWESDPDAWRQGSPGFAGEPVARRPGWFARLWARRAAAKAARRHAQEQAFEQELDRVLQRLHEVGMTQLTKGERKVLEDAAARRRGA